MDFKCWIQYDSCVFSFLVFFYSPPKKEDHFNATSCSDAIDLQSKNITILLEWLLLTTTNQPPATSSHSCVFLPDSGTPLTKESINTTLFERLLLQPPFNIISSPEYKACPRVNKWSSQSYENVKEALSEQMVVVFLYGVFCRCFEARKRLRNLKENKDSLQQYLDIISSVETEVVNNLHTVVHTPELLENQSVEAQFLDLLSNNLSEEEPFNQLILLYLSHAEKEGTGPSPAFSQVCIQPLWFILLL